jgi:hypothetical protein
MANDHSKDLDIHVDSHSVPNSSAGGQNNLSTGDVAKQQQQLQHHHNLCTFQELVGIRTPPHILSPNSIPSEQPINLQKNEQDLEKASQLPQTKGTPAYETQVARRPSRSWKNLFSPSVVENEGIYGRAIDEALKASVGYNVSTWFINSLYVVQIFVAATITGLASYHGHEIPLTVLGAVNAILAGLMALIKGQGLPVRLRRSRDQFQNVMKTIENTERMFARFAYMDPNKYVPGPAVSPKLSLPDPFEEYQKCMDLYDAAKRDQQASTYPIFCFMFPVRKCSLMSLVPFRLSGLVFEYQ